MPRAPSDSTLPLPRWLIIVVSVLLVFHFSAVIVRVLAAESGPWPGPEGGAMPAGAPQFAYLLYQSLPGDYLKLLQMTHDCHFNSDMPRRPGIYIEAKLKNKDGKEIGVVRVPEEGADAALRQRQEQLVRKLGMDEPVNVPMTELVAAPGQQVPTVTYWKSDDRTKMSLKTSPINDLITANRQGQMYIRPSELALLYARSYARYLCRTHGAASVEIIRYHQDPIPPGVLFDPNIPADAFPTIASNFGELPR